MGSSKKKGQQRKAAKKALSAAAEGSSSGGVSGGGGGGGCFSKIVAKIRSGDNKVTKKLFTAGGMASLSLFSYEHSGVLSVVLDYLKRCEDDTFEGIMASVGGDLKSPSLWISVLVTASYKEPSCKLLIVQNIGPLVRCMVNDTERLLFKSSKHWRRGIVGFFNLVMNVMETKEKDALENMQIVEALLQHEGLLRFIIQWIFWLEYRPDIVKELKSEDFLRSTIIRLSMRLIEMLVLSSGMKGEGRNWLLEIGSMPIVSKEYDPNFMLSYTAKMVNQLKETKEKHKNVFKMVRRLIRDADCVDKGVITEMIDWGTKYVSNYDDALKVGILFLDLMNQGAANKYANDTRVAFTIREGLIEMCLGFIKRFSDHESFENDDELPMHDVIRCILYGINNVSLHEKTAKAIRNKRSSIKEKLVRLEQDIIEGIEEKLLRNDKDNSLLQIESILNLSGSYCCRCNKSLSKTEVMQCNGCHRMVYCSRACQKEDWLNGHMLACCSTPSNETAGTFQGRYWPERVPSDERAATKLKEIEINMNMIQLKLFLDRSDTIRRQAKDLNLPLYDCVVIFDLRECPPTVNVMEYTKSFGVEDEIEGFEETRSEENIMCVYHSRMYNRSSRDELSMQRFFPHEWLKKQS